MNQKLKILGLLSMVLLIGLSCQNNSNKNELTILPEGNHRVEIVDIVQTNSYTYLQVDEDGEEYWMAVSQQEFTKGDVIYHLNGMEMKNFESKDLGRTFDRILFVADVSDEPIYGTQQMVNGQNQPMKPNIKKIEVTIETPEGGVSIGDLFANKDAYKDQQVIVSGQVTKVNVAIMGKNWVHIQDGSGDEVHFDLTVTTQHQPKVGDVVTYKGKVGLDRDFGMGYTYELIVEEAEALE